MVQSMLCSRGFAWYLRVKGPDSAWEMVVIVQQHVEQRDLRVVQIAQLGRPHGDFPMRHDLPRELKLSKDRFP